MQTIDHITADLRREIAAREAELAGLRQALAALEPLTEAAGAEAPQQQDPPRPVIRAARGGRRSYSGVTLEVVRDRARQLGRFTNAKLAGDLGVSRQTTLPHLRKLVEAGAVVKHARSPQDPNTEWEFVKPSGGGPNHARSGGEDLSVIGVGAAAQARGEPVTGVRKIPAQNRPPRSGPSQGAPRGFALREMAKQS